MSSNGIDVVSLAVALANQGGGGGGDGGEDIKSVFIPANEGVYTLNAENNTRYLDVVSMYSELSIILPSIVDGEMGIFAVTGMFTPASELLFEGLMNPELFPSIGLYELIFEGWGSAEFGGAMWTCTSTLIMPLG